MADRFPLVANSSTNQIAEIPSGDQLNLSGNNIANAGIITATTFHGSGANLTSIPAGNLTGTVADARISTLTASKLSGALPAISGANLTNLDASDLASGTIPDARFPATLPAISGANLTGIAAGVSEIDHWIVTTTFNGNVNPIQNNLSRYTQNGVTKLGTGMSVSSGTWTFPSTGFWRIIVHFQSIRNPAGHQCKYMQIRTNSTTNNSNYSHLAIAENSYYDNYGASSRHGSGHSEVIFDCQNTSTHKIKFESVVQDNSGSGAEFNCSSTIFLTGFAFIKIAET
tara:strand:- start:421 stop:1275 length:855 start_codon:yes stop_codon:yes gene_type:complete